MQHLTEEQLVLHHYHDDDASAVAEQHLRTCGDCSTEYEAIQRVLAIVDQAPVPERGDEYGQAVWNRLRWRLERRRRTWPAIAAAAAVLAFVFFAGQWWQLRKTGAPVGVPVAQTMTSPSATAVRTDTVATTGRVLLVVVSDHLDSSERVLAELANADPRRGLGEDDGRQRAADLVADNRIYRQSATQRGDRRLADLLADLEPILIELSNHEGALRGDDLRELQQRIEAHGLLFKVRVASAQTAEDIRPPLPTNSL